MQMSNEENIIYLFLKMNNYIDLNEMETKNFYYDRKLSISLFFKKE